MEKFVLFLLFVSTAHCADVSLSWNANSESDLAGYRLHWGKTGGSPTQHIDVGNVATGTITGLETRRALFYYGHRIQYVTARKRPIE